MLKRIDIGKVFLLAALIMLLGGLLLGVLASQSYVLPGYLKEKLGFVSLRPMHVSAVMFWILLGATGCVYCCLPAAKDRTGRILGLAQLMLWLVAVCGIFSGYYRQEFGGREYWEFDPVWALPIAGAWLIFIINFFRSAGPLRLWPVYRWMWMTGCLFFLFTFIENYLWLIPYFRNHLVTDMTIQWKVNGSLVGSWNQIIYGTAFFLMEKISGDKGSATKPLAFFMYFLGLFNLMFNWGHHIYTLPTENYVRFLGYGVSMTEWIIFARIVYTWKQSVSEAKKQLHYFPYRFLLAADAWVFLSLSQALFMSIPAINVYTHGTHVTVAHAMGTTIGINSMILLGACFEFLGSRCSVRPAQGVRMAFWTAQLSLLVFWIALNGAGISKGIWQLSAQQQPFSIMMQELRPWFITFVVAGVFLMASLSWLALNLIRCYAVTAESRRALRTFVQGILPIKTQLHYNKNGIHDKCE